MIRMLMLELADGTPCQVCISTCTFQGRGHWLEVYGDRGTLVLGSDNQKDYVHGFRLWRDRGSTPEVQIPGISPFLKPTLMVASHRLSEWQGARNCSRRGTGSSVKEFTQLLMDLTHESDATGWVHVPDLNAFLAVSS